MYDIALPILCCLLGVVGVVTAEGPWFSEPHPPGKHVNLRTGDLKAVASFAAGQPIIGTYLFYWYDVQSKAHVTYADGGDACTTHPPTWKDYSYLSDRWWREQLRDITAAGIDFAAPVYWGCPHAYGSWSFKGLPHLVAACDQMERTGEKHPKIALFYDTSTLRYNKHNRAIDVSTPEGKAWFYCTVRDFWSFIPPKHWAAIGGRPIILLYASAFAARHDPSLFPYVRKRFRKDFGVNPYIIKQSSWRGRADSTCEWGGALGLKVAGCAALGPGYDHSAVRGRTPLVRDREEGAFYSQQWEILLRMNPKRRPKLAMVETWNEFHEGTDIAPSKEYGRQYVDLTRKYADLFHAGVRMAKIAGQYSSARKLSGRFGRKREDGGISVPSSGDGVTVLAELGGAPCIRSAPNKGSVKYIYFDLHSTFAFDLDPQPITIRVDYHDGGCAGFALHYDSLDPTGSVRNGAFKPGGSATVKGTGAWRTASFIIKDARFANRCNGSDFRLAVRGRGDLSITKVDVIKGKEEPTPRASE